MTKELSLLDIYLTIPEESNVLTHKGVTLVRGNDLKVTFIQNGNIASWGTVSHCDALNLYPLRDLQDCIGSIEDFKSFCSYLERCSNKEQQSLDKVTKLLLKALRKVS